MCPAPPLATLGLLMGREFDPLDRREYAWFQVAEHLLGRKRVERLAGGRRRRLLDRMRSHLERLGKGTLRPVDRVGELSLEEFRRRYQRPGIPVVFEGAARDWPCCREWSLAALAERYGDDVVFRGRRFESLREALASIEGGGREYLQFYALLQRHPERLADLDLSWLKAHRDPERLTFDQGFQTFIGNATAAPTPLHNANDANLFTQVRGRKHWIFYPSAFTPAVDPRPTRSEYRSTHLERRFFDPFAPDYERYPMFACLDGYETVLEPGDVLWNPPYVWHAVRNLDSPTIGVGYRWVTPASCFRLAPVLAALDCLATNPPVWTALRRARQSFQLIFLGQIRGHERLDGYAEFRRQVSARQAEYRRAMRAAGLG